MHTDQMTIRTTTIADLSAVDALLARSFAVQLKGEYPTSTLVMAAPLISRARPGLLASGTYFAVHDRGRIVGAGGWSWSAPTGVSSLGPIDVAHVRQVITDHRHTRCGVGRMLMARTIANAKGKGVGALDCLSTHSAVPFYKACGFDEVGAIDVHLRPGIVFGAVRMMRAL